MCISQISIILMLCVTNATSNIKPFRTFMLSITKAALLRRGLFLPIMLSLCIISSAVGTQPLTPSFCAHRYSLDLLQVVMNMKRL